jgi:NhaA family Na+:H+ antiporter
MKQTKTFTDFLENEKSGGLLLLFCAVLSLVLTNSPIGERYGAIWTLPIVGHGLEHWVNDGLMAIFFLLIGLELKRELIEGELSNRKTALLPVIAALGGMVVPATIHLSLNAGTQTEPGAGIPIATDIAFAIGALSLLGKRIPPALTVFLTALAVIDDLGAIVTIAIFYSTGLSFVNLGIAAGIYAVLFLLNRFRVQTVWPYLIGGVALWFFMLHSGIHATLAGVFLATVIPSKGGNSVSLSLSLERLLEKPVAFIVLPLFALANTSIVIHPDWANGLWSSNSLGIIAGLIVGKPIGITLFSFMAVTAGVCSLPDKVNWKQMIGAGCLGGIGFTMSIFITLLAFDDPELIIASKTAIMLSSCVAGVIGYVWLRVLLRASTPDS